MEAHQLWTAKLSKSSSNTHPVSCMWHNPNRAVERHFRVQSTYICMYILYVQCHHNGVLRTYSVHAMEVERNSDHIAVSPATKVCASYGWKAKCSSARDHAYKDKVH